MTARITCSRCLDGRHPPRGCLSTCACWFCDRAVKRPGSVRKKPTTIKKERATQSTRGGNPNGGPGMGLTPAAEDAICDDVVAILSKLLYPKELP